MISQLTFPCGGRTSCMIFFSNFFPGLDLHPLHTDHTRQILAVDTGSAADDLDDVGDQGYPFRL